MKPRGARAEPRRQESVARVPMPSVPLPPARRRSGHNACAILGAVRGAGGPRGRGCCASLRRLVMLDTLPPSVTKALRCDVPSRTFRHLTAVDQIGAAIEDPSTLLWLDLTHPTEDELGRLAERFHLHPLAVEDALHRHQPPKIEEEQGLFFLVFYAASAVKKAPPRVETAELRMFVGATYLITIHDTPVAELDEAERPWTRAAQQVEDGIAALLYVLLDTVVDHHFTAVDELVEQAEGLEERIYSWETRDRW